MKIIAPSVEILGNPNGNEILKHLELCGRVCYKSEDRITDDSAERFVRMLIKRGHESVLEHASLSVRFGVDRGISHEIVRHRIASYSQESTRYCRYGDEITVILPPGMEKGSREYDAWYWSCRRAEDAYLDLLSRGVSPQIARDVLPHSLKTELIMTANLREWRHFLKLRTDRAAHPQMREVAEKLLSRMKAILPVIFEDVGGDDQ